MEDVSDGKDTGYNPETETYHAVHDWTRPEPVSTTLLRTVAVATNRDPLPLEPLHETIDVDALDRLYEPRPRATQQPNGGCLTFIFAVCDVTIYLDGTIVVAPDEDDGSADR